MSNRFDIAVVDTHERPVLAVEAKAGQLGEEDYRRFTSTLAELASTVPFAMFADPAKIQLYKWDGKELSGPVSTFQTREILGDYEPEFDSRRVFESYFTSLVEAWLRDLAYHWKSDKPPGSDELKRIGLLDKLEGGSTLHKVEIGGGHLGSLR